MRRKLALLPLALALAAPAHAQGQQEADVAFIERTRVLNLARRCEALSNGAAAALESGAMVARNALLRAGWDEAALAQAEAQAARSVADVECDHGDALTAFARVEDAFEGLQTLPAMTFVGDHRTWTAAHSAPFEGWVLSQDVTQTGAPNAVFGLGRRTDGGVRPALALPSASRPRAARLHVRDTELQPTLISAELRRLAAPRSQNPLAERTAPAAYTSSVWASERTQFDAVSPFAARHGEPVTVLWFPDAALERLAALDPREAVMIEIERASRSGETEPDRLYLEVGDFTAAALIATAMDQPAP